MIEWRFKTYNELTKDELYALLRLRAAVFVVEQDCPYQDVDNKDQLGYHLLGFYDEKLVAYLRIFKPGDYFQELAIGRVVVDPIHRSQGLGHQLMQQALAFIETNFDDKTIRISAQTYLKNFYEAHGFKQIGEGYLEDGLPHIGMLRL